MKLWVEANSGSRHHVTDYELEDLSIKPSILIEYVETKHMYARNEIKFW